ncbi:MAG TPA: Lrp/AsnC ligand binding domain-containing protein [Caldisericia bacterium]|jgi:DNA-binding Lrp family transcriptional regulator|nr:Lrp/AsnC ligand binding domain-containing protein [Caldisericia bacterium]HXK51400.1 Lrp/AsnC ligand binding domain-containing protein [Caldisericia bacterium]
MISRGYVLLEAQAGKTEEALNKIRAIKGVKEVNLVTGPYDLIINIEADDLKKLGQIVSDEIQIIGGVTKTITCIVIG